MTLDNAQLPRPGQLWQYRREHGEVDRIALIVSQDWGASPDYCWFNCVTLWLVDYYALRIGTSTQDSWVWPDDNWELICDA